MLAVAIVSGQGHDWTHWIQFKQKKAVLHVRRSFFVESTSSSSVKAFGQILEALRFLAALKTRLGLILAKAVAMRVMINATGCPAPVSDRNRTHTHKHLSQLIELAIDHDIPTPV